MELISINETTQSNVAEFFIEHWGSTKMVISSGVYDCSKLSGFVKINHNGEITGLITYIISGDECEIISLDSKEENKGIGSSLVKAVEEMACKEKCKYISLITTNDNLSALKFYQKRGYFLASLHRNAVEKAREMKPEIPFVGNDGIPIRDEIELAKRLS
ncbi:GNAT family N-acetyltransferase [Halobacillus yeomjeoni]|uniref:GNAT family N-acetyltransferase n=1 Tax=Halobacillus yeomjeoni TaxID=311194 RepID=UPI001CD75707|nr:GNAT family N-acetyltransferase [Halobacillus yeomjeoni]MCA0983509.1 GNAT family N-acetyltransferase [Halobacillus yeomjeoni]